MPNVTFPRIGLCPPVTKFMPEPQQAIEIPMYCSPAEYGLTPVATVRGHTTGPPLLYWSEEEIPT